MFVCICNALRERQIETGRELGIRDPLQIFEAFQCEPRCSSCIPEIETLLARTPAAA